MRRRHQPKRFAPPRSRRAREAAAPPYGVTDILKDTWSDGGWERPAWAKLSLKQGWITAGDYYAIEPDTKGQSIRDFLYEDSAFFGLLKKDTDFGVTHG